MNTITPLPAARHPVFAAIALVAQAQEILERHAASLDELAPEAGGEAGNEGNGDAAALQRLYFEDDSAGGALDGEAGSGAGDGQDASAKTD